ncbi:MAG: ATP-binding protein [Acidobacteria bacterium]|nr:ATP-binding protein [Acidobacteriota bacterium]
MFSFQTSFISRCPCRCGKPGPDFSRINNSEKNTSRRRNTPGWERWVRRVVDTEDVEVFVTGSSSRLLTRDLASALRGRSITPEIFPLGFRERLSSLGIEAVPFSADSKSRIRHELEKTCSGEGSRKSSWPKSRCGH